MPSPQTIDIETLLDAIPGEKPAGESLRYTEIYTAIPQAMQSGDNRDPLEPTVKKADWPTVIDMATDVLQHQSKDLQIAAWAVEALVGLDGFAGLRDGLSLLSELQDRFWESLYPGVEEGQLDLEYRAGPLEGLNQKLPTAIRGVPLTYLRDEKGYSWRHWKESRDVENFRLKSQTEYEAALADDKITGERWDKAVAATSLASYETLFEDLQESREAYERLNRVLDERFGREAPNLLAIKEALDDCSALIEAIVKNKEGLESKPTLPEDERKARGGFFARRRHSKEERTPTDPEAFSETLPLEPQDRDDALRRLAAVAAYFRRTEPHSPVSYLVGRAIRWGEMPLEEWLHDVIGNDDVLSRVRETLGLKESDASSGSN
jgi:type VI secretion system protein ImpA